MFIVGGAAVAMYASRSSRTRVPLRRSMELRGTPMWASESLCAMQMGTMKFGFTIISFVIFLTLITNSCTSINRPNLTCAETLRSHLVPMPMNCVDTSSESYIYNCTKVYQSQRHVKWMIEIMLMVKLGNYGADEPYEEKENCIGINVWKGKSADAGSHFIMNLSPSKIIGTVNLKRCGTIRPRSCAFEVKVLPALLALPQFQFAPDEPPFWNFSSPLFRFDVGWLYCLEAASGRGPPAHWPAALPGLAGASVACVVLDGVFGADALGPLPSLSRLPLLENVVIRNSPMRGFPPGYFDKSEKIKSLVIKHSVFRKIPSEITVLKKLRLFSLESIVQNFTFDPNILSAFTNLWTLNLAGTRIEHWPGNIPKLQKLSILDLNRCQMKTFSAATPNLPALKYLSLKQNLISFLDPDAFAGIPNIRAIFLNQNFINILPPEIFVGLYRLHTLDLTSNRLTEWPQLPPNDFLKLNLSANNISKLINLGCQVRSIDFLDFSSTNLSQWDDPKVFLAEENCTKAFPVRSRWSKLAPSKLAPSPPAAPRAWVSRVNLSSNSIAVFSAAMLRSLDALAWAQLGGNAVDCGACASSALQGWLRSARAQAVAAGGPGGVRCRTPAAWAGRPVLSVDFDALCDTPRPALWLGLGLALAGAFALVCAAAGLLLYFRTEVAYLLHLAKRQEPEVGAAAAGASPGAASGQLLRLPLRPGLPAGLPHRRQHRRRHRPEQEGPSRPLPTLHPEQGA
ncbi:Protein lap1 [Gryllus bimaculatus]|nr:Protein lap1 [Gryllus bimaculatus]